LYAQKNCIAPMGCSVYLARPRLAPCKGRKEGVTNRINIKLERYDTTIDTREFRWCKRKKCSPASAIPI
jgi:hypothetical protein